MQNLVAACHTVRAYVGGTKNGGGGAEVPPHGIAIVHDPAETHHSPPHVLRVTMPNLVAVVCGRRQGAQKFGTLGPRPLGWGRG